MPAATATGATIEIDGQALSPAVAGRVAEVVVDQDVHLPASFEIRFSDPDRTATADIPVKIASKVKVTGASVDGTPSPVLSGEVTALEADYSETGSFLVVRGYDMAHRLHRGRHTRVFTQMMYSDVAQQIASDAGLDAGTIDPTGQVKDHVPQVDQSDWSFLRELADEIDYELSVVDGALNFHAPTDASQAPSTGTYGSRVTLQLVFGEDLLEFRPRVTAAGQVDTIEVRSWDGLNKQVLVGTAQTASSTASLDQDPQALSGLFGDAKLVAIEPRATDQDSADKRAARIAQQVGTTFAEATGTARGNAQIQAGRAISVSVVGEPFVGSYTLTHSRHVFDHRGYRTYFVASGRQDRSLLGLVRGATAGPTGAPIAGVVSGVVTDTGDPQNAGRVKVQFQWLADDYVSDWARVALPGAGPSRGVVWLPEVNDEVLVAFEHGDVRRPIVLGGLWNSRDTAPPYGVPNGQPNARALVSLKGHKIVLHDENDGSIEVATPKGLSVLLDDDNGQISIKAGGGAKLVIDAEGDISISGQGNVEIKSGASLSLSGATGLELKSDATTTVKGQMLQLNPPG
ncbi:MAG: VgrG-related protein [Candidatus Limnocylindrales bacterium]|jgi:phage protein D